MARIYLTVFLSVFGLAAVAAGREWTDASGSKKIEAEFVELDKTTVRLELPDGKLAELDIQRLSEPDQDYVMKQWQFEMVKLPKLSAEGQKLLQTVVDNAKKAAANTDSQEVLVGSVLRNSKVLVKAEGTRRVLATVIIALMDEPDQELKMAALEVATEVGDYAYAAGPAILSHADDEDEVVRFGVASLLEASYQRSADNLLPTALGGFESESTNQAKLSRSLTSMMQSLWPEQRLEAEQRLTSVILNEKKPEPIRIFAAQAIADLVLLRDRAQMTINSHRHLGSGPNFPEASADAPRDEILNRKLLALLEDAHPYICSGILEFLIGRQPELLHELPPPTVRRILDMGHGPQLEKEEEELFANARSPLNVLMEDVERSDIFLPVADKDIIDLLQSEEEVKRQFVSLVGRMKLNSLLEKPEFLKLFEHADEEVRMAAVQTLVAPGDRSFSLLPQVKLTIAADAAGKIAKFTVGSEAVTNHSDLAKAIERQNPTEPADAQVEEILFKAAEDSSYQVSNSAFTALVARGTPLAAQTVRKLAVESLRQETRELAKDTVQRMEWNTNPRFREPADLKAVVEQQIVLATSVDDRLLLSELFTVLKSLRSQRIYGVRWLQAVGADENEPGEIEIMSSADPDIENVYSDLLILPGPSEQELRVQRSGHFAIKLPSLAALRSMMILRVQPEARYAEDSRRQSPPGLPPLARATQESLVLTPGKSTRCDYGRKVLSALIYDPESQLDKTQLVNTLTWFQDGRGLEAWYLRAVK